VVGDGSKHASLVSAVGGDTHIYKNGYLLKGKYPQLQVLEPPFPEGWENGSFGFIKFSAP